MNYHYSLSKAADFEAWIAEVRFLLQKLKTAQFTRENRDRLKELINVGSAYLEHAKTKVPDADLLKEILVDAEEIYRIVFPAHARAHWWKHPFAYFALITAENPAWWAPPVAFVLRTINFGICTGLTLFVRDEEKRKRMWEFYTPFGRVVK
jgi:hypothetical protein